MIGGMNMRAFSVAASALLVFCTAWTPVWAATPEETAFGLGQFSGAATFCKLPSDQINEVAAILLKASGIDPTVQGPLMTRFTEGVTDGIKAMSAPNAASCADVTTAFQTAYKKVKP